LLPTFLDGGLVEEVRRHFVVYRAGAVQHIAADEIFRRAIAELS
jgi:hypothetical protein